MSNFFGNGANAGPNPASDAESILMALPGTASPQVLGRGKTARSKTKTFKPLLRNPIAHAAPAGPAPEMTTSYVESGEPNAP